ncbi:hypothetical protein SDRG_11613 [Saprolegnia diclina VS20]|uniref:Uncharacterized protein n=1 Tax=Saprolegnia diclina (strain VS20) TaxID=1156394 RepID=T0RE54_SAPDV|nr:hypothetical protein SDRG_11613 [Saprolegnia diclina VS20]EQC30553.1 hypothetical protein SDRG_11613 [Saprolegnia diclina VS20]|eukprot:XP_008615879.1 hypothetical protein SDRG_11613 [Saprolegnia diclina VS20]
MATRSDLDEMEADALPSALAAMAECVKYTSGLAAFYEASFDGAKAVHASQTKEGVASLQEALALVTSNLTNMSSTLTAYMDCQCDELDRVHIKVDALKLRLAEAKAATQRPVIEATRAQHRAKTRATPPPSSSQHVAGSDRSPETQLPYQYGSIQAGLQAIKIAAQSQVHAERDQLKLRTLPCQANDIEHIATDTTTDPVVDADTLKSTSLSALRLSALQKAFGPEATATHS